MSISLRMFGFDARAGSQWESNRFYFGESQTVVHGPNGAGKTPLLKGIAYGLGYPVELTPDVRDNFEATILEVALNSVVWTIHRSVGSDFSIRAIRAESTDSLDFHGEKEFSLWILEQMSLPITKLTDKSGNSSIPYISILVPGFYVDQDLGWQSFYSPHKNRNFIKDQEQEVVRFFLGLPPKNEFRDKADFARAQNSLEVIEGLISMHRELMEKHQADMGGDNDVASLEAKKNQLSEELRTYQSGIEVTRQRLGGFDAAIGEQSIVVERIHSEIAALDSKKKRLNAVSGDISSETQALLFNSVAAEAFREFCGQGNCGLFKSSEDSYGRRLLYLRDQLKDVENTSNSLGRQATELRGKAAVEVKRLESLLSEKEGASKESGVELILSSIEALTKALTQVSFKIEKARITDSERRKFDRLLEQRDQARAHVEELKPRRRGNAVSTSDVRSRLRENIQNWLSVLNAKNISSPVIVDEEFKVFFGKDRFTESSFQSGSTRTRIVLAFHAALLQTSLQVGGNHPGVLIFDAPKQHELNDRDLNAYFDEFKRVSRVLKKSFQIVFSVSDISIAVDDQDEVWLPQFGPPSDPRYFGRKN